MKTIRKSHHVDLVRTVALHGLQTVKVDATSIVAGVVRDQIDERKLRPIGRREEVATFPLSLIRRLDDGDGHMIGVCIPGKRNGKDSNFLGNLDHVS